MERIGLTSKRSR